MADSSHASCEEDIRTAAAAGRPGQAGAMVQLVMPGTAAAVPAPPCSTGDHGHQQQPVQSSL